MNTNCYFCNKPFETYMKQEKRFYSGSYDAYTEDVYYPKEGEAVKIAHAYCCHDCYDNLYEIVKARLIKEREEFLSKVVIRKEQAYEQYLNQIHSIETEAKEVSSEVEEIKCDSFTNHTINRYPYTSSINPFVTGAIKQRQKREFADFQI